MQTKIIIILFIVLQYSCNNISDSTGEPNEITIITSKEDKDYIELTLLPVLKDYIYTPIEENRYKLSIVNPESFKYNKYKKNIILMSLKHPADSTADLLYNKFYDKYNNDLEGFKWVVESAGKTKVVVAGGHKKGIPDLLQQTYEMMQAGASGIAIGRNIWQHKNPLKITKALKSIIFNHKSPEEAKRYL